MANPVPSVYFPSVSLSGANELSFNTAGHASPTFPELTNAEADPSTGDIRKMAYAILLRIAERHAAANPQPQFVSATSEPLADEYPNHRRVITLTFVVQPSGTEEVRASLS